jgi:hypothetical protein
MSKPITLHVGEQLLRKLESEAAAGDRALEDWMLAKLDGERPKQTWRTINPSPKWVDAMKKLGLADEEGQVDGVAWSKYVEELDDIELVQNFECGHRQDQEVR